MEAKFLASALSFLSIFLAIHAQSHGLDSLEPNYHNKEHEMVFYTIRKSLLLRCNLKEGVVSNEPLIWKKNNASLKDVPELNNRYNLIHPERTFVIEKTDTKDEGVYSCEWNGESRKFNVVARVAIQVPSNTGVVEGEKVMITCTVAGTRPRLSWSYGNYTNITSSIGRIILKEDSNKIANAILMIENVTMDDRGEYKCFGRNEANDYNDTQTVASDFTTVRVKGKYAALWPFLGICAEVLILCLIILIYEKRRNKSELEESDTDPQEQ